MSELQTIENLDEAEEYFGEAYDRLMASRVTCGKVVAMAEECLAYAEPILKLIQVGRVVADGETMKNVEAGIAYLNADRSHAESSLARAEKNCELCASLMRRMELYLHTKTGKEEVDKQRGEFSKALWHVTSATEEVQALHLQAEVAVANLAKWLPL